MARQAEQDRQHMVLASHGGGAAAEQQQRAEMAHVAQQFDAVMAERDAHMQRRRQELRLLNEERQRQDEAAEMQRPDAAGNQGPDAMPSLSIPRPLVLYY